MKFLCPACERLADVSTFRVEGAALVLWCERCGVESRSEVALEAVAAGRSESLDAAASTRKVVPLRPVPDAVPPVEMEAADPFIAPPDRCPKCVAPRREEALACATCGLVFANFRPEEHRPSPRLEEAWRVLLDHWEDRAAHERFVKEASLHDELAPAGRLYRLRLARSPEDAMAAHGRDTLLKLAASPTVLVREVVPQPTRQPGYALAGLFLLLLLVMGAVLVLIRKVLPAP